MERKELTCSWLKPLIIPPNPASFTLALQVYHWGAAASGHEFTENPVGLRPSALVRWSQIARHGSEEGQTAVSFQRQRADKKERQRVKPPFPSHRKKWKLVSLPGRMPLFWCFYSNSFYVPILQTCWVIIMQYVKKTTKMSETIRSLVIRQIQTSLSKVLYCRAQTEHWQACHKFKMTWHHGFPKKQREKNDLTGNPKKGWWGQSVLILIMCV